MRIIAGTHRGRRLLPPASETTRPITDRVKQSIFDVLTPLLADSIVFDMFAGTGSIGLECLSRGSQRAEFFESDRGALALLRRNIADLGFTDRAIVRPGDVFAWMSSRVRSKSSAGAAPSSARANLIFLDPPYRYVRERPDELRALSSLMVRDHLASDGTLILRHDASDQLELNNLTKYDGRDYGGMVIQLLTPTAERQAQTGSDAPSTQNAGGL